ncbi:GGDEF domain-containing protein [Photobacterium nomapromontoriensis]|uniref:GGDEF domain-containing protein n=1 Tax=Photobacterium nomapromontoriensis TaxID=2910237 RepID=UPI003D1272E1
MTPQLVSDMDGKSYFEFQQYFRQRQGWKLASFTFFVLFTLVAIEVFAVRTSVPLAAEVTIQWIAVSVLAVLGALAALQHALPALKRWQIISSVLAGVYGCGWAGLFTLPLYGAYLDTVALYSDLFIIIAVIAFFSYRSATYLAVLPVLATWMVSDMIVAGTPEALILFTILVRLMIVIMVREYLYFWFHSSVWHGYEEQRLRLELANVALIDHLTGLQNRKHFDIVIEREVLSARRENKQLTLVALSIDPLRLYSMTYGQQEAKSVLKRIGRSLRRGIFRPRDFLARLSSDEFVVLLPDTDLEGAMVVVDRLQGLVHQSCDYTMNERLKTPVEVKGLVMEWQPDVSATQLQTALRNQLEQLREIESDNVVVWQPE